MNGPGRYLSPEPILQSPGYMTTMAARGMQVPTYAYAANNPLRYVDPDGLRIYSNVSVSYDYTTPGPRPNTRFTSYSGGHTGCQKVGGKWKFDATVNSVLDVFMVGKADRGSLNDGNACSIAEHEEKHVQDYVEGLEELDQVFKSEGFRSQAECESAVRSFEKNLRQYIDFLTRGYPGPARPLRFRPMRALLPVVLLAWGCAPRVSAPGGPVGAHGPTVARAEAATKELSVRVLEEECAELIPEERPAKGCWCAWGVRCVCRV